MPTTPTPNKIKYGLKNVHYAIATIAADGTATFATPVAIPGAVNLSMEPKGEMSKFNADNIEYWTGENNRGYEGNLEMAIVPDHFKMAVLGYVKDSNNILYENQNPVTVHFALLFEFAGDVRAVKHVMYNCVAGRPAVGSKTKGDTIEPETETLSLKAGSIYNSVLQKDIVKSSTMDDTTAANYEAWYTTVQQAAA